jgi:hypothetical protein
VSLIGAKRNCNDLHVDDWVSLLGAKKKNCNDLHVDDWVSLIGAKTKIVMNFMLMIGFFFIK